MPDKDERASAVGRSLSGVTIHVVRSFGPQEATARLSSQPLVSCVGQVSSAVARLTPPDAGSMAVVADNSILVFHYNDFSAIAAVRALRQTCRDLTVACLCSDIYSFHHYINVHDIVDVFIAPTEAHRRVLAYQLYKPVYVMPEAVDSVVPTDVLDGPERGGIRDEINKRVVWFGYAESFDKGMASVVPIIRSAVSSRAIDGFRVITNRRAFAAAGVDASWMSLVEYTTSGFFGDLRASTYAVLSHMPLDLELNSLIKSPNKLVTSLISGLVPLCSDTPNYADLLGQFGLGRFVFSSPAHLASILSRLDPKRDVQMVQGSGIIPFILDRFSQASIARRFLEIMEDVRTKADSPDLPAMGIYASRRTSSLREHLSDLLPSAQRFLQARANLTRHRYRP